MGSSSPTQKLRGPHLGCLMFWLRSVNVAFLPPLETQEMSGRKKVLFFPQIFGIIFTICDEKVIDKWGTLAGNIFLTCFLLIGTIITGEI